MGRTLVAFGTILLCLFASAAHVGCRGGGRDFFVIPFDAGTDSGAADETDAEPGVDPSLGGPCTEDAQCDDLIPCTFDRCDKTLSRCRNTPDNAQCADGVYCNGAEVCKLRQGCVPGPVISCGDGDNCTIDRCLEATRSCEHAPRDADGDGDPDDHCAKDKDCDDTDPTVSSTRAEICHNFKDDNCDGQVDEAPCAQPANDVCATALEITAEGNYLLTTVAAQKDYPTSCSVPSPAAAHDIVVAITVPQGGPRDIVVRVDTSTPQTIAAVALQGTCGTPASEIACGYAGARDAWVIARSVASGTKVFAVVTTQFEAAVDLHVEMPPGGARPTNEGCGAPKPVDALNQEFSVLLIDPAKDVPSGCDGEKKTGELTYSFALSEELDVTIFASTLRGYGLPIVSMRDTNCTTELRCRAGSSPPVFARHLFPGTYFFTVAATSQIEASIIVKTDPFSPAPENQSCGSALIIPHDTNVTVDLAGHEDAIKNGCMPGGPNAAYKLDLGQPSDVLIVGRFPLSDVGAVSLNAPACKTQSLLECSPVSNNARVSLRNLPAGDYRVVIADQRAMSSQLLALVRSTIPPVTVTSDSCVDALVIPETGGFFVGDTTAATANFNASCDASGQPIGGANDHLLRLVLSQRRRVVFDMSGSVMSTILDVRTGGACPGMEVPNACALGTSANRSYLDITLDAGTYWVQVDGYNGAVGQYNLDVRVLSPSP